jgi:hypothetical protein
MRFRAFVFVALLAVTAAVPAVAAAMPVIDTGPVVTPVPETAAGGPGATLVLVAAAVLIVLTVTAIQLVRTRSVPRIHARV